MSSKEVLDFTKTYLESERSGVDKAVAKRIKNMDVGEFTRFYNDVKNKYKASSEAELRSMKNVEAAFAFLDYKNCGYLKNDDLVKGLKELKIEVTEEESERILKDFSRNPNKGLSYEEFVLMVHQELK